MSKTHNYAKGFVFGTIIGGAVGAVAALLFAPKTGKELRSEIADKSEKYYKKAAKTISEREEIIGKKVQTTVNEGRIKAQSIIDNAKKQADEILYSAESLITNAKERAKTTKESVGKTYDEFKSATSAGVETFKEEFSKEN